MDSTKLKQKVCKIIEQYSETIIAYAQDVEQEPELGFREFRTAEKTAKFFRDLGLNYEEGLAITGVKAKQGNSPGPTVAVLGELDAIICYDSPLANPNTGAAHACGHNIQLGAMMGAAIGLTLSEAACELNGNLVFMATPAEEYLEIPYRARLREEGKVHFCSGKQELVYRGAFDEIDMAMMIHAYQMNGTNNFMLNQTNNGFVVKDIRYEGKEAHAAAAPEEGINALNAAMLGLMGINAMRETFRDEDVIRVHPIVTKGGDVVNSVPADVRIETFVRAKSIEAIESTSLKVERALRAGGDAIGAKTHIATTPGYLPIRICEPFSNVFSKNVNAAYPGAEIIWGGHSGGSTDMGDVSHIMPVIHPYTGGVNGALHTRHFRVVDYNIACIIPAKIMAMTVIDLLAGDGKTAQDILTSYKPAFNKAQYIAKMNSLYSS